MKLSVSTFTNEFFSIHDGKVALYPCKTVGEVIKWQRSFKKCDVNTHVYFTHVEQWVKYVNKLLQAAYSSLSLPIYRKKVSFGFDLKSTVGMRRKFLDVLW